MSTRSLQPELHSFPSTDGQFRTAVSKAMESDPVSPAALAELLRPAYPAVDVRERDTLAELSILVLPVWYAYRDGEAVPEDGAM